MAWPTLVYSTVGGKDFPSKYISTVKGDNSERCVVERLLALLVDIFQFFSHTSHGWFRAYLALKREDRGARELRTVLEIKTGNNAAVCVEDWNMTYLKAKKKYRGVNLLCCTEESGVNFC